MITRLLRLLFTLTLAFVATVPFTRAADDSPTFVVEKTVIPSPASASPSAYVSNPQFAQSPDGTIYLSWLEASHTSHFTRLCLARYLPEKQAWSPPSVVAQLPPSDARMAYALATGPDHRFAVLLQENSRTFALTTSTDSGATWTKAIPLDLALQNQSPRIPILRSLADGRLLAVWLNDAATPSNTPRINSPARSAAATARASLYVRFLDAELKSPAQLIETPVSSGSEPDLVAFPDGSALLAWRGLSADGAHDIRTARFDDGKWQPPATLNPDNWHLATPPADGPVLASRGAHLSAAWFTATYNAQVNVSGSSNAGTQWFTPNRVDDIDPLGRPSLVMLDDGSSLVSWVEQGKTSETVFLRRLSAHGGLSVPVRLAENITGHPRIVRVKDGDSTPAQLLLLTTPSPSSTRFGNSSPPLATTLITLPDSSLLAEADLCGCDPRPEDQRGYPFRGRISAIDPKAGTITIAHAAIPGIMKAATTVFQADPVLLADLKPGMTLFARTERLGPDWRFFAPRVLVVP